jgi:Zn-dependent alcohol dehydrogenase
MKAKVEFVQAQTYRHPYLPAGDCTDCCFCKGNYCTRTREDFQAGCMGGSAGYFRLVKKNKRIGAVIR